jgi:hypothetical protein
MVPSVPGNSADYIRPGGLRCFTPNIVPRPSNETGLEVFPEQIGVAADRSNREGAWTASPDAIVGGWFTPGGVELSVSQSIMANSVFVVFNAPYYQESVIAPYAGAPRACSPVTARLQP